MAIRDEERIKQYREQYTDIILYILTLEDPKHNGIDHMMLLNRIIAQHYRHNGRDITDEEVAIRIKNAAAQLAMKFLENGKTFNNLYSSELFELIEPILSRGLP